MSESSISLEKAIPLQEAHTENFTVEKMVDGYEKVYRKILNKQIIK